MAFLANITNCISKCLWHDIITINGKSLLTEHGQITMDEVLARRNARNIPNPQTVAQATPKIKAIIIYHFVYDSLEKLPKKRIATKMAEIGQDGPTLLKMLFEDTYVATQTQAFTIKERGHQTLKNFDYFDTLYVPRCHSFFKFCKFSFIKIFVFS